MKYGLGIDTGGTYTDAVIYDFGSSKILVSAKSATIKENLSIGINNVLGQLPKEMLQEISFVSLSTTLATNACVEGKGGRAVLIMLGCSRDVVERYGREYGLPPAGDIIFLDGGHNQQGDVKTEPDWSILKEKVMACKDSTDSFGVVELWGIRNPEHEQKAKELIMEWTGMPVVCGHELTPELNSLKRAVSVLLNAQLIFLINAFMDAVKASLKHMGINAPLMIVRGDGSLMSEEFAREKPVETLLSGPAASVAGGMALSGSKNCMIVDMGGTTSDLAIVRDGRATLAYEGVNVGSWKTGTASILIDTVGLGGDSIITYNNSNEIGVGPVRVAPLSWLAQRWPGVLDDIRLIHAAQKKHTIPMCEFFYLLRDISEDSYYTEEERKIAAALTDGPLDIMTLANAADTSVYTIKLKRLEQHGIIMRSALTPTDIMHITGDFRGWNVEAATLGANIMAHQLDTTVDDLVSKVNTQVKEMLYFNIVKILIANEDGNILGKGMPDQLSDMIMMGYGKSDNGYLKCRFTTDLDLVGIGAPIHIFLPDVAAALGTRHIIPENAPVANAVGAITGSIMVEETVTVRPVYKLTSLAGYIANSSAGRKTFERYEDALEWAKTEAAELAEKGALARGAGKITTTFEVQDNTVKLSGFYSEAENSEGQSKSSNLLLETMVKVRAAGTLKWL